MRNWPLQHDYEPIHYPSHMSQALTAKCFIRANLVILNCITSLTFSASAAYLLIFLDPKNVSFDQILFCNCCIISIFPPVEILIRWKWYKLYFLWSLNIVIPMAHVTWKHYVCLICKFHQTATLWDKKSMIECCVLFWNTVKCSVTVNDFIKMQNNALAYTTFVYVWSILWKPWNENSNSSSKFIFDRFSLMQLMNTHTNGEKEVVLSSGLALPRITLIHGGAWIRKGQKQEATWNIWNIGV